MKRLISLAVVSLFIGTAFAQTTNSVDQLLGAYYQIKDALVNSNSSQASNGAAAFGQALKLVDVGTLNDKDKEAVIVLQTRLTNDAQKIAGSTKIEDQRSTFASFSNTMWDLLKLEHQLNQPAYLQYCPMKKSYWISKDSNIKNPYYGKQMLTCGKTTETLK